MEETATRLEWDAGTVPYSFAGCDVRGYADGEYCAYVIEHDRSMIHPFILWRYDCLNDRAGFVIIACCSSLDMAYRKADEAEAAV